MATAGPERENGRKVDQMADDRMAVSSPLQRRIHGQ